MPQRSTGAHTRHSRLFLRNGVAAFRNDRPDSAIHLQERWNAIRSPSSTTSMGFRLGSTPTLPGRVAVGPIASQPAMLFSNSLNLQGESTQKREGVRRGANVEFGDDRKQMRFRPAGAWRCFSGGRKRWRRHGTFRWRVISMASAAAAIRPSGVSRLGCNAPSRVPPRRG